jgi:tryptophanyl-tRNA synthetase
MMDKSEINPWDARLYDDYGKLMEDFGIDKFESTDLPEPHKLLRRGVVFGHRGFEQIRTAITSDSPFAILTGLSPSGAMHLGHKMTIDEVIYFQSAGADVSIAVADIESYAVRGMPLDKAREIAINEYVLNYISLGMKPEKCQIYFQSKRAEVKDLAYLLGRKTNLSTMKAIYGFEGDANMSHVFTPLVQVGDILHVQLERFGGPRPTLVPVGVDQDPHIRLSRDISGAFRLFNVAKTKDGKIGVFVKGDEDVAQLLDDAETTIGDAFGQIMKIPDYKAIYLEGATEADLDRIDSMLIPVEAKHEGYAFYPPAATYHRLLPGLTGDKMSSSIPGSAIYLTDTPEEAAKKIQDSKTGGRVSADEQKKLGGNPDGCSVFDLFMYHLIDDDAELEERYGQCKGGEILCGHCKKYAIELMGKMLADIKEKREQAREMIGEYVVDD